MQDVLSATGIYYYRIRSIDRDGKTAYSAIKSVKYQHSDDLVAAPNPFLNAITISNLHNVKRVELVDLSGRVHLTRIPNNQTTMHIDAAALPAGMYQLRAVKTDGSYTVVKLVKM